MIKAILIDDEKSAILSLTWEIENFCEDVEIIDSFTRPLEAISAIDYLKPDCVFLDIEMPEMDGFQLLNALKYKDFDLIITTAFDNYAIKAFRESAIDYLLKPIDSDDLIQAVSKIKNNKNKNNLGSELKKALAAFIPQQGYNKIGLPMVGKTKYVTPNDIFYCKSDGNYCEIFFTNGKMEMLTKKIKEIEEIIKNKHFFRVHNSYLVNINYIKEYVKTEGQYLVLENGTSIPVSRSKRNDLLSLLGN